MNCKPTTLKISAVCFLLLGSGFLKSQEHAEPVVTGEKLLYHFIHVDGSDNTILPWVSPEPGIAYDRIINLVWDFWDTMRIDLNGIPYYMNHQVWRSDFNDRRGIGGDQLSMALSSWNLYYAYSGNEAVKENMKFIADYYLSHSLSPAEALWPDIPYPYNTLIYSGLYDGDMVIGKGYTQPDKAGSFGLELVKLFKMTSRARYPNITDKQYLDAAVRIANTLAGHTAIGDEHNSPLPFKVNAMTGETGYLKNNSGDGSNVQKSSYTTNWSGTLELFLSLIDLEQGNVGLYQEGFDRILSWMKNYPLKNSKWGPFFEDIPGWSDTQINAITFAWFMMNHPEYFPEWETEVKGIFDWVYEALGNHEWEKYGVTVVNEQTAYQTPGNSHTSRQASAELQYAKLTGEPSLVTNAVRQLNWATYMVDHDGKNCYPRDENWLTDGYGDYVRHYLRAMAALPQLAPAGQNHLLSSSSVIQLVEYPPQINKFLIQEVPVELTEKTMVHYRTFDNASVEVFRLSEKPDAVWVGHQAIPESAQMDEGWQWDPLSVGGVLTVRHESANRVIIFKE
jgi:hypothetical protein